MVKLGCRYLKIFGGGIMHDKSELEASYKRIMQEESAMQNDRMPYIWSFEEACNTALQLEQIALNSLVDRSYNSIYHLHGGVASFESDGAHTNFVDSLAFACIRRHYGPNIFILDETRGITTEHVHEAIKRHDLEENRTGDCPDSSDEKDRLEAKFEREVIYQREYCQLSPSRNSEFDEKVNLLLDEMRHQSSELGKIIYVADKIAAVLFLLTLQKTGRDAYRTIRETNLTDRDKREIYTIAGEVEPFFLQHFLGSEMWTVDYLSERNIARYDTTGFYTSILVAYTLIVRGEWYEWRERQYYAHHDHP